MRAIILFTIFVTIPTSTWGESHALVKKPNVLFIALDDLNDWVGCLGGHPQARTPNIDRLAKSGLLFTNAHCAAPACNPSRTSIFTGLSPHRSGIYRNRQKMRELLPKAELLPHYFSRQGYWSAGSGKLLHYFIDAASWDDYYPPKEKENPFPPHVPWGKRPKNLPRGGPWQYVETDWAAFDVSDEKFGGDFLVTQWVSKQLARKHKKPFFLACGIYRPHEPWYVPKKYFDLFPLAKVRMPLGLKENDLEDVPQAGQRLGRNRYLAHIRKHKQWKKGVQAYLASIAYADAMVGRVLDALKKSPYRDNTIVVLWSDHGWHLGEKEHWQKFTGWRVCTRVPLIVRAPKHLASLPEGTTPGSVCNQPVSLLSLFPTLTELCGLPKKADNDGPSLVPLLKDPKASWKHVAVTHLSRPKSYAISTASWRYLHYADGGEELYQISTDPYEWTNLAKSPKHAAKLTKMRALAPKPLKPQSQSPRETASSPTDLREAYRRADRLRRQWSGKVYRAGVEPHWLSGGSRFWYVNRLPKSQREYVLVDAKKGERKLAFDHARLTTAFSRAIGKPRRPQDFLPSDLRFSEDGEDLYFRQDGKSWHCDLQNYVVRSIKKMPPKGVIPRAPSRPRLRRASPRSTTSPDGSWTIFRKDDNLWLRERATGKTKQLTRNGRDKDSYSERVFWSPDSSKMVALRTEAGSDRTIPLIESSPRGQLQPKLHQLRYRKPGDKIPHVRPQLFDVKTAKAIPVNEKLFPNPWSIQEIRWASDSSRFTFLYNQRGHQILRLIAVDASSGKAQAIINEQSKTFIDYAHKQFIHYLDKTDEIIWMSERDGWNHLYLYDSKSGQVKNRITKGNWVVRGVSAVDPVKREIRFRAGGIDPSQDPYHVHFCRIGLDGKGLIRLTEGDGDHSIQDSPDKRYVIDTYSRVDLPPVTELRRARDGKRIVQLERADVRELRSAGWRAPERFVAKGRDGKTNIYGVVYRPAGFDPKKKYPIIEKIYAGPQGAFVPKRFRSHHSAQDLTELGFVVVQIDGMGTSHRSKAFHDKCWKNLGDAGFPDRILWMKALAKKYPWIDLQRVGIYGTSAGGQSTLRGLLVHGDFYKVGVASCGCHDNRMDKIWWNELWMGWPIGPHYKEQSNVTQAHRLKGKLLLIVGELDRNVDPASTLQVVNALIRARREHELVFVPGMGHSNGGSYGERKRRDFFVRHLLGKASPNWNQSESTEDPAKKHPQEKKGARSLRSERESRITFINKSGQTVKIYWLDFDGERVLYQTLKHGEKYELQRTYLTHPWLVTDKKDQAWEVHLPKPNGSTVVIEAPKKK